MSINLSEETVSSRVVAEGRRLLFREDKVRLSNGVISHREIIVHPKAVVILPLLDDGRVVLIRQYRTAAQQVMLEVPAGVIESGEDPEFAAQRELREETGYASDHMVPLFQGFPTPGFCTEYMYFFVANQLRSDPLTADFDEMIETVALSVDEAIALVANGGILDLKTIAALYAVRSR